MKMIYRKLPKTESLPVTCHRWFTENIFLQYMAPPLFMKWLESFKEFPPRQKPASFSIDQVLEKMMPKS